MKNIEKKINEIMKKLKNKNKKSIEEFQKNIDALRIKDGPLVRFNFFHDYFQEISKNMDIVIEEPILTKEAALKQVENMESNKELPKEVKEVINKLKEVLENLE